MSHGDRRTDVTRRITGSRLHAVAEFTVATGETVDASLTWWKESQLGLSLRLLVRRITHASLTHERVAQARLPRRGKVLGPLAATGGGGYGR